jgi:hypothetical protein
MHKYFHFKETFTFSINLLYSPAQVQFVVLNLAHLFNVVDFPNFSKKEEEKDIFYGIVNVRLLHIFTCLTFIYYYI